VIGPGSHLVGFGFGGPSPLPVMEEEESIEEISPADMGGWAEGEV
jgi:hypothetical protein